MKKDLSEILLEVVLENLGEDRVLEVYEHACRLYGKQGLDRKISDFKTMWDDCHNYDDFTRYHGEFLSTEQFNLVVDGNFPFPMEIYVLENRKTIHPYKMLGNGQLESCKWSRPNEVVNSTDFTIFNKLVELKKMLGEFK